jgi:hypothetical protein
LELNLFILIYIKGTCIALSECTDNFVVINSNPKICVPCDISCLTCNENKPNNCITCVDTAKILKKLLSTN